MSGRVLPLWIHNRLARVPLFIWIQDHQCMICGKPTKRRGSHWPCERSLGL